MGAVFLDVVLPGRWSSSWVALSGAATRPPSRPLRHRLLLFSPALVFHSLAQTTLSAGTSLRIFAVMSRSTPRCTRVLRCGRPSRGTIARCAPRSPLGATTPNVGNMGLPSRGSPSAGRPRDRRDNFVAGALLANSAGIAIASRAGGSMSEALRAPFRYRRSTLRSRAAAVNVLNITPATPHRDPRGDAGGCGGACDVVVLGLQLQQSVEFDHIVDLVAVNASRLMVAPVAAWGAATARRPRWHRTRHARRARGHCRPR